MIPVLRHDDLGFTERFARLTLRNPTAEDEAIGATVRGIIAEVRAGGDRALLELTRRYDERSEMTAAELELPREALAEALLRLEPSTRAALERAAARIRAFHELQRAQLVSAVHDDGRVRAELAVRPLARVGVYVPGGTAAYPSTALMNIVPAKAAGVPEVVMVTPAKRGQLNPAVLAAAHLAGADRVFAVGGAQAVAALAHGTERVPAVLKIVGPGNAWVQEAKRQVQGRVAIDQLAGPSEVLILADDTAAPELVAADLLAQAEHDVRAASVLVTWSEALLLAVEGELAQQLPALPRAAIARQALELRGGLCLAADKRHALELARRYAPEHLGLCFEGAEAVLPEVDAAGAVFVGHHAPEALGDYNAGPNHVLPTGGSAASGSPLSVHDFVKRMNVLSVTGEGLSQLGPDAARLARVEGLEAHARAIELRLKAR